MKPNDVFVLAEAVIDNRWFDEDIGDESRDPCRYCMEIGKHDDDCAYLVARRVQDGG
jgi:hypothetical protein